MKSVFVFLLVLLLAVPVLAQDGPPPPPDLGDGEVVLGGLNGPQGLHVAEDGSVYVIDSGFGGEETIDFVDVNTFEVVDATFGLTSRIMRLNMDGEPEVVASLPSIAAGMDFVGGARVTSLDGTLYATVGAWQINLGEDVSVDNYTAVVRIGDMEVETVADPWAHEVANNPDGSGNIESHPYGITVGPDGMLYVADAAANAVLKIDPESGEITTLAAIEPLPGVFPNPFRDGELLRDAVPTGIVVAEDGTVYVSLLTGAPFMPGTASVIAVDADGNVSEFAGGMTMLTDLTMGPDGKMYAVSFGMFTEEGPVPNSGQILRISEDGTVSAVVDGLPFATGIAVDADGNGYVSINGIAIPEAG